jgi:putative ubiquitin-RnfH superfamily antitoxin RatB of RatAB toxin-antitoxin module
MPSTTGFEKKITVQVVYALPHAQHLSTIQASNNDTIIDAVKKSTLLEQFPELALNTLQLGVFGKVVAPDAKLDEGMRIEIYRPLILDPKESRRRRAQLAKK